MSSSVDSPAASASALTPSAAQPGTLTAVTGCMFSGKTTELLGLLRGVPANRRLAFKHARDRRYQAHAIVSHDGDSMDAEPVRCAEHIVARTPEGTELVVVDEGHFFDDSLVRAVVSLTRRGPAVVVAGLDLSSWGRPFPAIARLTASAHQRIHKHTACARCGASATHTQRLTPIVAGQIVGGAESFEPRCLACWRPPPEDPVDVSRHRSTGGAP